MSESEVLGHYGGHLGHYRDFFLGTLLDILLYLKPMCEDQSKEVWESSIQYAFIAWREYATTLGQFVQPLPREAENPTPHNSGYVYISRTPFDGGGSSYL